MASVKVLAGDFVTYAPNAYHFGMLSLTPKDAKWGSPKAYNPKVDVIDLAIAGEQSGVKAFGAVGWGDLTPELSTT